MQFLDNKQKRLLAVIVSGLGAIQVSGYYNFAVINSWIPIVLAVFLLFVAYMLYNQEV